MTLPQLAFAGVRSTVVRRIPGQLLLLSMLGGMGGFLGLMIMEELLWRRRGMMAWGIGGGVIAFCIAISSLLKERRAVLDSFKTVSRMTITGAFGGIAGAEISQVASPALLEILYAVMPGLHWMPGRMSTVDVVFRAGMCGAVMGGLIGVASARGSGTRGAARRSALYGGTAGAAGFIIGSLANRPARLPRRGLRALLRRHVPGGLEDRGTDRRLLDECGDPVGPPRWEPRRSQRDGIGTHHSEAPGGESRAGKGQPTAEVTGELGSAERPLPPQWSGGLELMSSDSRAFPGRFGPLRGCFDSGTHTLRRRRARLTAHTNYRRSDTNTTQVRRCYPRSPIRGHIPTQLGSFRHCHR